jgi:hypothetical protein
MIEQFPVVGLQDGDAHCEDIMDLLLQGPPQQYSSSRQ